MFRKRIDSFRYAWKGCKELYRSQPNLRIHLGICLLVIAFGLFFRISYAEWAILFTAMGMVLSLEAVNTALEYLTDLASPQIHPLAGKVKDVAAAAVLTGAFFAALTGLVIFLPKLWDWLSQWLGGAG